MGSGQAVLNELNNSRVVQPDDDRQRTRRRFSRLIGNLATEQQQLVKRKPNAAPPPAGNFLPILWTARLALFRVKIVEPVKLEVFSDYV
jgi:uncharacterized coiled-coil protein SlyX